MLAVPDLETWQRRLEADLRADWRLGDERPLETDGWSGAAFSVVSHDDQRLILKRTSAAIDWIARATLDDGIREATLPSLRAGELDPLGSPVRDLFGGFLDAARAVDGSALILQADLGRELGAWPRSSGVVLTEAALGHLLDQVALIHVGRWSEAVETGWSRQGVAPAWCPLPERLTLLTRRSAEGYAAAANPVGPIFLRGWNGFERHAPREALDLVEGLGADPGPLVDALARLPARGLHGDLKLANIALDGAFIDWQMMLRGPVAVDLGWFLVTNSAELPLPPDEVLARYLASVTRWSTWDGTTATDDLATIVGDWAVQVDLAMIVGLILRGWRKGRDTDDGATLGSGVAAADDLAWWCRRALDAADRRL